MIPHRRPLVLALLAAPFLASAAPLPAPVPVQVTTEENRRRLDVERERLEREFVIGPSVAGQLGYRVAWQAHVPPTGNTTLRLARAFGEGIFALDSRNGIIRLRPTDGEQMWRVSIANPVDIFRGAHWVDVPVTHVDNRGRATVTIEPRFCLATDIDCWVLDAASGSLVSRQRFAKLPSTPPIPVGRFFIYGTLGGHIVWHQFIVGQEWRANSVDAPIRTPLAHGEGRIIAASDRGMILCLDDETARRRWVQRCFGGVSATPAIGDRRVYVASHDQYLWCYDLEDGDVLWKHFTESPLRTPPFSIPGAVLQYVPTAGLICFAADSQGRPGGLVRWTSKDAVGVPKGLIGDTIALWDEEQRILTRVDAERGSVVSRHELKQVADIQFVREGTFAGDILASNEDGRIVRLIPQRARSANP